MLTPGHHCVLISAAVVGLALGPLGLKRISPNTYTLLFEGSGRALRQLKDFDQRATDDRGRLDRTGVTDRAILEFDQATALARAPYLEAEADQQAERIEALSALASALVLAVVVVIGCESILQKRAGTSIVVAQLATARSALLGAWLVLTLAQPQLIHLVSAALVAMLVAIAVIPAMIVRPQEPSP